MQLVGFRTTLPFSYLHRALSTVVVFLSCHCILEPEEGGFLFTPAISAYQKQTTREEFYPQLKSNLETVSLNYEP